MYNEAVSDVDETNSVSTSPIEETHDESIWGVDETNSMATRRIGAIHADTIWKVDATSSEDDETTWNNGSTSRKISLHSNGPDVKRSRASAFRYFLSTTTTTTPIMVFAAV